MKITLSAAMRARDVSRPRPEQLAEAAGAEPRAAADEETRTPRGETAPAARAQEAPQPRSRRRRRRLR
jgi:hypothetical protein